MKSNQIRKTCFFWLLINVGLFLVQGVSAQSIKQASIKQNVTPAVASQTIDIKGVTFAMVLVKGGTFMMGANESQDVFDRDEKPVHKVDVKDFYIGAYEVTQQLWEVVMGTSISQQRDKANKAWPLRGEGDFYPMYYVSYDEVQSFISRLNRLTGKTFALPTEAQWEYAAKGGAKGTSYKFSGDTSVARVAWFMGNSKKTTHLVGQKAANELGLYDMSGNVWEWCNDWYSIDAYKGKKTGVEEYRVLRGGFIMIDENSCRVSNRGYLSPSLRNSYTGFRVVLEPEK